MDVPWCPSLLGGRVSVRGAGISVGAADKYLSVNQYPSYGDFLLITVRQSVGASSMCQLHEECPLGLSTEVFLNSVSHLWCDRLFPDANCQTPKQKLALPNTFVAPDRVFLCQKFLIVSYMVY